jgi:hypothetical protein
MKSIEALNPQARIWVYQANEPFGKKEVTEVEQNLQQFAQQWVSHNHQLKAGAAVLYDRFLVLAVDETQAGASGCSIDSSVNFLKKLGAHYQRDLFDRLRFSYVKDGEVHTVGKDEFAQLYKDGIIDEETVVFDPLVKTVAELSANFEKPLKNSWHARFV